MSNSPKDLDRNASSSEEEGDDQEDDAPIVESLVEGRQKRSTAGQRMSALINQEVDDDLELLFAEADEEDVDFEAPKVAEGSDAGVNVEEDEDDSLSSDDTEQEGDELSGEKQLNKEERSAKAAEKRKVHKAFRRPPTAPRLKKVRIAEDTNTSEVPTPDIQSPSKELTGSAKRPKRSERLSIPTPGEGPRRTSSRTLSVQNKEKTIANMKESEDRRFRQIAVMEAAQSRKQKETVPPMTQAEKLAEAVKTERRNKKSLNRWEQMEIERQEKQRAKLEALQNRTLAGPVITFYSGPAEWVDGKLKYVGRRPKVEEIVVTGINGVVEPNDIIIINPTQPTEQLASETVAANREDTLPTVSKQRADQLKETHTTKGLTTKHVETLENIVEPVESTLAEAKPPGIEMCDASNLEVENKTVANTTVEPEDFLAGIQYYASLPETGTVQDLTRASSPSAPTTIAQSESASTRATSPRIPEEERPTPAMDLVDTPKSALETTSPISTIAADINTSTTPGIANTLDTNGTSTLTTNIMQAIPPTMISTSIQPVPPTCKPPTPPTPVVEYSSRNLLILQNYDPSVLKDKDILRRITFGTVHSSKTKLAKTTQTLCAITSQPARYRDPKSGLPYAGMGAYRGIQNLVTGGARWSNLLGAWVGGPEVGSLGAEVWQVKKKVVVVPEVEGEGDAGASVDVKMEGAQHVSGEASAT